MHDWLLAAMEALMADPDANRGALNECMHDGYYVNTFVPHGYKTRRFLPTANFLCLPGLTCSELPANAKAGIGKILKPAGGRFMTFKALVIGVRNHILDFPGKKRLQPISSEFTDSELVDNAEYISIMRIGILYPLTPIVLHVVTVRFGQQESIGLHLTNHIKKCNSFFRAGDMVGN